MKLDFMIFGKGHGLAQPWKDGAFYWLVDKFTGKGAFYHWSGWFGAQLASFQWTHPRASERRQIMGREFQPNGSQRAWGRVRVSWTMCRVPDDTNEANKTLHSLQYDLRQL